MRDIFARQNLANDPPRLFWFQAGGQGTHLVLVAVNQEGCRKVSSRSAATRLQRQVLWGRNAQASTDSKLNAGLLTYSRSKGLLAGTDLDGTSDQ